MHLIPAATVILLREHRETPEILLLHRNPGLAVQGNVWVFPGGRIEPADGLTDGTLDAARACAVREAREEAGLQLTPGDLVPMSRWVTPEAIPKRFDTWFFMAVAKPHAHVRIDRREIVDHCWNSAQAAIAAHHAGHRMLSPPGFVLLSQLAAMGSLEKIWTKVTVAPPRCYTPRLIPVPDGACNVYQQDAAFHSGDLTCSGTRHRLWMRAGGWRYEVVAGTGRL